MFYQVRIKRADGTLKKIVSEKKLNNMHWDNFQKSEEEIGLVTASKQQVPAWVKRKLDLEYMETYSDMINFNG
jgi:Holliday junction resolvasome RuvABC endonuclease subunit